MQPKIIRIRIKPTDRSPKSVWYNVADTNNLIFEVYEKKQRGSYPDGIEGTKAYKLLDTPHNRQLFEKLVVELDEKDFGSRNVEPDERVPTTVDYCLQFFGVASTECEVVGLDSNREASWLLSKEEPT